MELGGALGLPLGVWTDLEAAHAGALEGGRGILVIGGTGSAALGFDGEGRLARAGGFGPLLGDPGSGTLLLRRVLRFVLEGKEASSLHRALPAALGGEEGLRSPGPEPWEPGFLRKGLQVLQREAEAGDPRTLSFLGEARDELLALCLQVREGLGTGGEDPVVLHGGLLQGEGLLRRALQARLRSSPGLRPLSARSGPERGAALLAADRFLFEVPGIRSFRRALAGPGPA